MHLLLKQTYSTYMCDYDTGRCTFLARDAFCNRANSFKNHFVSYRRAVMCSPPTQRHILNRPYCLVFSHFSNLSGSNDRLFIYCQSYVLCMAECTEQISLWMCSSDGLFVQRGECCYLCAFSFVPYWGSAASSIGRPIYFIIQSFVCVGIPNYVAQSVPYHLSLRLFRIPPFYWYADSIQFCVSSSISLYLLPFKSS